MYNSESYEWSMTQKDGYAEVYLVELNAFRNAYAYVLEKVRISEGLDSFYIPTEIREVVLPYKHITILFANPVMRYGNDYKEILYTILIETVQP